MQPVRQLRQLLDTKLVGEHYLFAPADVASIFGSGPRLAVLLSRAARGGLIQRVCKGIYYNPRGALGDGRILFHAAARLRASAFNYISCETALSDAGAISQIPVNTITLMSSGRSHAVDCGTFGRIEFIHTRQKPAALAGELVYDTACRLWRASPRQALRDMRAARRDTTLINIAEP